MSLPFVNLHTHSYYSILQAPFSPKNILKKAESLGCPAVALTDRHGGYGLLELYLAAQGMEGMRPILGAEVAISLDSRFEKRSGTDGKEGYVVLLAQNYIGYKNLMKILSKSYLQGYFYQPRADLELLEEHCGGLTVLTGDREGILGQLRRDGREDKALEVLDWLVHHFGKDHVYLEVVSRHFPEQKELNEWKVAQSKALNLDLVVTSDSRYADPGDEKAADIFHCIGSNESYTDPSREKVVEKNWFKSWEEMQRELVYIDPEILEKARQNTLKIAESCDVEIPLGEPLLPKFDVPEGETVGTYLRRKCEGEILNRYAGEGVRPARRSLESEDGSQESGVREGQEESTNLEKSVDSRQKANSQRPIANSLVQSRLDYELEVIGKMGFEAYFLIVADFVEFAKEQGISVGPGRGSAAGSLVSYLLGITNIDPLEYELLFERFLNPERISMPDIDIDFSDERRDEVLDYVIDKYGTDKVSKVCTFGTLAAKAALKDVGRALGVPFTKMNAMTKLLPGRPGFALKEAEEVKDFTDLLAQQPDLQQVFEIASKLEGCVRHVSVHACAVIIGQSDLSEHTPLQWAPGTDDVKITQFPYQQLDTLGLLKMDFLGLKNLSLLEKALENVAKAQGIKIDLQQIPICDQKTFEMLSRGETTGVFQFESAGMRRYLKELRPTEFDDLIAMNALYRPGPMDMIPQYIERKNNPKKVKYEVPALEPFLKKTYGIIVYQEQVQRVAQDVAGFTLGEGYLMIKAVAKKIPSILDQQKKKFMEGAQQQGHSKKTASDIFALIEPFAGYGFNKSHSTCYARIAYETAYMRAHYPVEFMAAMMTVDRNNTDRIALEINECQAMEIEVLPPGVNESESYFGVEKQEGEAKSGNEDRESGGKRESGNGKEEANSPRSAGPIANSSSIRFGLTAIKGLGEETVEQIMQERDRGGPYTSLENFATRLPSKLMNKKTLEALAFSGAFDSFGDRGDIVASLDDLSKFAREQEDKSSSGQIGLFAGNEQTDMAFQLKQQKATKEQILQWERDSMGLFVSDHPLRGLSGYFEKYGVLIGQVEEESGVRSQESEGDPDPNGSNAVSRLPTPDSRKKKKAITIHGLVTSVRKVTTRTGALMLIFVLEDTSGKIECVVFPKVYETLPVANIKVDRFLKVEGKAEERNGMFGFVVDKVKLGKLDQIQKLYQEGRDPHHEIKPHKEDQTWVIDIPDHVTKDKIHLLKQALIASKSEAVDASWVVVYVKGKKVDLPFKVLVEEVLKEKVKGLLEEEKGLQF